MKFLWRNVKAGPFGSAITKDMYKTAGYKVYGQEQVIPNDFTVGDYYLSGEDYKALEQYAVLPDDILISCVGTFGKIAIVPSDIEQGVINPRLIRLRPTSDVSPKYLVAVLQSAVAFEQFSFLSRGGTMDVINIGTLKGITLPVPPIDDQEKILRFMSTQTTTLDNLVQEASRAIDLLQERRMALISAAVTGKIDVRGLAEEYVA